MMQSEDEIEDFTQWLMSQLGSYEPVMHYFQLLLVWEKPFHSVAFVIIIHMIFW